MPSSCIAAGTAAMPALDLPFEAEPDYWVAFSHVPGIGPVRLSALAARFGGLAAAWQAPEPALAGVLDRRSLRTLVDVRRRLDLGAALRALDRLGASIVHWGSPDYPLLLRDGSHAPYALYVLGDRGTLSVPSVAVVGTRRPTAYGRQAAADVAYGVAAAGVTIVSGMALGIDAVAHRSALDAGGLSVAVLGCGLDVPYPVAHRGLQQAIARAGAVISEYPLGARPEPGRFPARNRIVAGLCAATVVVEAGETSGALITARLAAELGRDVLAVPGPIYSPTSAGTNRLLAEGAGIVRGAGDVLDALSLCPAPVAREAGRLAAVDASAAAVLAALAEGPRHIDELARRASQSAAEVARALTILELRGLVRHQGQMVWSLAPGRPPLAGPPDAR